MNFNEKNFYEAAGDWQDVQRKSYAFNNTKHYFWSMKFTTRYITFLLFINFKYG